MAENLLRNPGCEEGAHQQTRYWTPDGGPFTDEYDNIWPPIGWKAWWIDRRVNDGSPPDQKTGRPEFHTLTVPPFPDPVRLRSGQKFAKLHTFFRTHYTGWLQQVAVVAGSTYRFSVYAHSWYSDCSYKPHTIPLLDDCDTPASDSHDILQVGIGPSGDEQSPLSDEIVWSDPVEIYGGYKDALTVEVKAETSEITAWLRSWTNYALHHQDVYWDDASLVVVDVPPPPPREYERTYVLYPQDVTLEELQKITREHYEAGQLHTIGGSADDSAIGHPNLEKRTIIVYWPDRFLGGKAGLQVFFDTYYPGVDEIIWVDDGSPPTHPILLWQRDPKWKDLPFGDENCHSTIGEQGCFICCLGMAQRFYDIKSDATPVTVDNALGSEAYLGCIANWRGQPQLYKDALGITVSWSDSDLAAIAHMDKGSCAMAEVLPTTIEHFVLVYGQGEGYIALDPWENVERPFVLSEAQSWRLLTKVDSPSPDPKNRISLHLQQEIGDWRGLSAVTIPMKFLAGIQNIVTVKQINGDAFPVWRQWVPNQGIYLEAADKDAAASAYLDTFRDSMEEVLEEIARTVPGLPWPWFGVESLNETYAVWDPSVIINSIPFDRAWIRTLRNYPEVAPVVFCAAVGNIELPSENPDGQVWKDLIEMGREGMIQNATFGYHAYHLANQHESLLVSDWPWLAGRWTLFDEHLVANGVHTNWFFGECGGVGGWKDEHGYHFLPNDGWKAPTCYAGNWPRYEQDLMLFNSLVQEWNATHDGRAYGGTLFTTGGGEKWKTFEMGEEQINRLITILS